MRNFILIIAVICVIVSVSLMLREHFRAKRIIKSIEQMLNKAVDGTFTTEKIDESLLSSLEFKFSHYLGAAETSAKNIALERDNIKTLISDISHQTKTPIASCLLYCELLQEQQLDEVSAEYVTALNAQAQKLNFLIASLIKMSRLETGILTLHPACRDVMELITHAAEQYMQKAYAKGLSFSVLPGESDAPLKALFDEKWTLEALGNIIDNAVKYTNAGGIITIGVKAYELFVCIEIADTGIGIAEKEQAQVFSRFYRSEDTADTEGVGIGLYLAREIITNEGGYIKLASSPGNGSVFSVYLPTESP